MSIVGYAFIKIDATTGIHKDEQTRKTFIGQTVRVLEFAQDGGAMVVNSQSTAIDVFDKDDISAKFECVEYANVICRPNINLMEQLIYYNKVISRKGGYNYIVKNMVIAASLHKGELTDGFLFNKP
jgi:hypothetical protein